MASSSLQRRIQQLTDWFASSERYLLAGAGALILVGITGLGLALVKRSLVPYRLELVAGKKTGESYILSRAIAQVLADETNLRVDVCETDGTDDNIASLLGEAPTEPAKCLAIEDLRILDSTDGTLARVRQFLRTLTGQANQTFQTVQAELGTAQADRPSGADILPIAALYPDQFQLLIKPERFGRTLDFDPTTFQFRELAGKVVGTPEGGGQRESFKALARHYDIEDSILDLDVDQNQQDFERVDAVFRVRFMGNTQIQALTDQGLRPVPIEQAEALRSTRYPSYRSSQIPQGVYRGYPAVPQVDISTIAVDRLLVARKDLPNWVAEKLTATLVENHQAIKDAVVAIAAEREGTPAAFDPAPVTALVDRFMRPDDDADRPIHPGARRYYERTQPSFVQKNADFLALLLTLTLLTSSWSWRLVAWRNRRKVQQESQILEAMKDLASDYVEQAVAIMQLDTLTGDVKRDLGELFARLDRLNQVFRQVSHSLDQELISQEGFRAFSEAYKSVREVLERGIEDRQRKFLSFYVEQVMALLTRLRQGEDPARLSDELEDLFSTSANNLTRDNIFSRESFRTFTEAYGVVREAIDRQREQYPTYSTKPRLEASETGY
ncbi:MAG: TAXI family TRAP transporter solute-binding subunit [Elainellaceae cyanobacterium]